MLPPVWSLSSILFNILFGKRSRSFFQQKKQRDCKRVKLYLFIDNMILQKIPETLQTNKKFQDRETKNINTKNFRHAYTVTNSTLKRNEEGK